MKTEIPFHSGTHDGLKLKNCSIVKQNYHWLIEYLLKFSKWSPMVITGAMDVLTLHKIPETQINGLNCS